MSVYVFAGPTIPPPDVAAILPTAIVRPPVAHGDLLALDLAGGDSVAIIDGVFFRTGAIRHKEVLHVLQQGVPVWGASSMGALRAAELSAFGMRGVGTVYQMYATGTVNGDDEVAVMHGPAESGYRPINEALVSIRVTAQRARLAAVLTREAEDLVIVAAKALPFGERTYPAIIAAAADRGLPAEQAAAFGEYAAMSAADIKREDAEALLRQIGANGQPPHPPAGQPMPMTSFLLRWIRSAPVTWIDEQPVSVMDTLTACQLFAADYPALHYRVLLADLVQRELGKTGSSLGPDADLAEWEELACAAAAARGLIPARRAGIPTALAAWLSPAEMAGPARPAIARALVRSYRWTPTVRPIDPLVETLAGTPAWIRAQAEVARAGKLNAELAAMKETFNPHYISDAKLHAWLSRRWEASDLRIAMLDRGFSSPIDLRGRAAPFLPLDALHGVEGLSVT